MKLIKYIKLGECALCPYASKKKDKPLMCNWNDDKKSEICSKIFECGNFPDISKIEVE